MTIFTPGGLPNLYDVNIYTLAREDDQVLMIQEPRDMVLEQREGEKEGGYNVTSQPEKGKYGTRLTKLLCPEMNPGPYYRIVHTSRE